MSSLRLRTRIAVVLGLLWIGIAFATAAPAQEAAPAESTETPQASPPAPSLDPLGRDTPQGAMRGYFEAARHGEWEKAARFLDLSRLSDAEARGPELARHLKIVLDRKLLLDVEIERLSHEPAGREDDELRAGRDRLATLETQRGKVPIYLDRTREDGEHVWLISQATVAGIPQLWDEFGYGPLARWLPAPLVEFQLFDAALWQWAAMGLALFLAWILGYLIVRLLVRVLRPLVARSRMQADDDLLRLLVAPGRLLATILLFTAATAPIGLSVVARNVLSGIERVLIIFSITWLLLRLVEFFALQMEQRMRDQGQAGATAFVPMGKRAIKIALGALAVLATLDTFGFDVTALIAGLGVGGLAVALAAQKTLENVFGGVSVLTDQPVRVGDFCRFGDRVGTVEDIGIRSTRLRTLDRTVVSIPNADFSAMHLENFAKRDRMFLQTTLGLRYETTPDQLRHVIVGLRDVLFAHPKISNEPARVRFVGFGDFSLNLEVFAYSTTTDWNEFLGIREDVYLRFMDVVEASGTGFAFPSSTTYLAKDEGLDAERVKAVEEEVSRWREEKRLMLPNHTPDRIDELGKRGEWPPPGTPQ